MKAFLLAVLALAASAAAAATLTIVVKEAAVKKKPQFYASTVGTLKLGDKVASSGQQGAWHQVAVNGQPGWLHQSAFSSKKVKVASGEMKGGTTAEEITLAGKGFNQQVEGEYKKKHGKADFAAVDALERTAMPEAEVLRFLSEGGLGGEP